MSRVWAIGDVHGEIRLLEALLGALPTSEPHTLVFLGDYIDRGEDSAAVVRRVLELCEAAPDQVVLLWGNHEDLAAAAFGLPNLTGDDLAYAAGTWLANGGRSTLRDFGADLQECPPELARLFPRLRPWWRDDSGMIYVHAGIREGVLPEDEDPVNLVWLRPTSMSGDPARPFVAGHTPQRDLSRMVRPGIAIIDGGAGKGPGGVLCALLVEEGSPVELRFAFYVGGGESVDVGAIAIALLPGETEEPAP